MENVVGISDCMLLCLSSHIEHCFKFHMHYIHQVQASSDVSSKSMMTYIFYAKAKRINTKMRRLDWKNGLMTMKDLLGKTTVENFVIPLTVFS